MAALVSLILRPVAAQFIIHDELEQLFGEPVTTSVTGSPQRASQVPAAMTIITADEIRRSGARDLPGVLRHVAGIDVTQWTNDHADVAIRGYNQAFTPRLLVLVDGRQVYADYYGFTPWPTVPVELNAIYQIEIVKGPSGALFGFNAVGGVINIITRDLTHEHENVVSFSGGTQDLWQASAVTSFHLGERLGIGLTGGVRRNDDFSTPMRPTENGLRRNQHRDAATVDLRWRATDKVQLRFEGTYSNTAQAEVPLTYTVAFNEYETYSTKLDLTAATANALIEAGIYRNWIMTDAYLLPGTGVNMEVANSVTVAQLRGIFKVGTSHTFRLSGEYRHDTMDTTPVTGAKVFYDVFSGGGMWQWAINSDLSLTSAIRIDHLRLGREGYLPAGAVALGLSDASWDRTITRPSFNVGIVWQAGVRDTVRLSGARGQQLPNLLNLGGNVFEYPGMAYVGNPTVDPAVVSNYELGWDRRIDGINGQLRVALFYGRSTDVISHLLGNVGTSRTIGLDLGLSGRVGDAWRWELAYLPQRIRDRFAPWYTLTAGMVDYEHTSPAHTVKANLGWTHGPWEVDAHLRYQSSSDSIEGLYTGFSVTSPRVISIGGHLLLDGRIGYRINRFATLSVSGQDLAGARQRQTSAPLVERRVVATLKLVF